MRAWIVMLALASPCLAEDWVALDTAGITAALADRALVYEDGAGQNFFRDGRTLYRAGAGESWGKWWAAADEYCSTWPPSETPACYRVETRGEWVRFVARDGVETLGRTSGP